MVITRWISTAPDGPALPRVAWRLVRWCLLAWLCVARMPAVAAPVETWWVPDVALADALCAALAEAWPEQAGRAVVRVGAPPLPRPPGASWDGRTVRTWDGQREHVAPAATAAVAVLLARTWAVPAELTDAPGGIRFLPTPPPQPPPPPPPPPHRGRWFVGLGTRTIADRPRVVDGIRLVADAAPERGPLRVELAAVLGPPPPSELHRPGEGSTSHAWADRATASAALALVRPLGNTPLALRLAAGPEVYRTERWLYVDDQRWSRSGWIVAGLDAGLGLEMSIGRWRAATAAIARAGPPSEFGPPPNTVGIECDVRYRWR